MNLKVQAARGLKWQITEIVGRQVISLLVFSLLARMLEPSMFGLVGLVTVYSAFTGTLADQGVSTALVQRRHLEPGHLNAAFWFSMGCAALLWLATVVLATPISRFLGETNLAPLLQWSSLGLVVTAMSGVHMALFVKAIDFRRPAIRTIISNVVGGAVALVLAWRGAGVWALVVQQLVAAVAGAIFLWSASSWRPGLQFSGVQMKELLVAGSAIFVPGLLWFFASQLDQIVIGRVVGVTLLGQYVVGAKLPILLRMAILQPVTNVSTPVLSTLQDDHPRMCQTIYNAMELNALVAFPAFIGLACVAPDVVTLIFGEQWEPAAKFMRWHALYNLAYGLQIFIFPAMLIAGGRKLYVLAFCALAAGAALACFVGIQFGPQVVTAGLVVNLIVMGTINIIMMQRRIGLSLPRYLKPCLGPATAALVMAAVVLATHAMMGSHLPVMVRLMIEILAGAAAYLGALLLTAPEGMTRLWQFTSHALVARPKAE